MHFEGSKIIIKSFQIFLSPSILFYAYSDLSLCSITWIYISRLEFQALDWVYLWMFSRSSFHTVSSPSPSNSSRILLFSFRHCAQKLQAEVNCARLKRPSGPLGFVRLAAEETQPLWTLRFPHEPIKGGNREDWIIDRFLPICSRVEHICSKI